MGLRVLLVQPSAVMGSLLSRTLRQSGLPIGDVCQAASWDEAVTHLARHNPDVVLLDADLPASPDGTSLDAVLARPPWIGVPCVLLLPEGLESHEPLPSGGISLRRPFTPQEVRRAVLKVLPVRPRPG